MSRSALAMRTNVLYNKTADMIAAVRGIWFVCICRGEGELKFVSKDIDAIAVFINGEKPQPFKFRYHENDESIEIRVGKVISSAEEHFAGQKAYVYECQSFIRGTLHRYQLKYILDDAKWMLYKI